jgi:hypothetical protein
LLRSRCPGRSETGHLDAGKAEGERCWRLVVSAFSDPARGATVGTHFTKVIEALGIKDEVMQKATVAPDGVETMRLVLDKKVDLGVSQMSEIVQANRDALVGPFPASSIWRRHFRCGIGRMSLPALEILRR